MSLLSAAPSDDRSSFAFVSPALRCPTERSCCFSAALRSGLGTGAGGASSVSGSGCGTSVERRKPSGAGTLCRLGLATGLGSLAGAVLIGTLLTATMPPPPAASGEPRWIVGLRMPQASDAVSSAPWHAVDSNRGLRSPSVAAGFCPCM